MDEVEGPQWPPERVLSTTSGHTLLRWRRSERVKRSGLPSWPYHLLDLWHLPKAHDPARAEIDKDDI